MRYHRTVAAAVIAVGVLASSAANAGARLVEAGGSVNSLSVTPASGTADVVIGVSGDVTLRYFTLRLPDRIVVDISGATLRLPRGDAYDHVSRGGIVNIRYSRFKAGVVRIVLTLDSARTYKVSRDANAIHVNVASGAEKFASWKLDGFGPEKQVASAAAPARSAVAVKPAGEPRADKSASTVAAAASARPAAATPAAATPAAGTPTPVKSVAARKAPTDKTAAEQAVMDRVAAEKSAAFAPVSVQPPLARRAARMLLSAGAGPLPS